MGEIETRKKKINRHSFRQKIVVLAISMFFFSHVQSIIMHTNIRKKLSKASRLLCKIRKILWTRAER